MGIVIYLVFHLKELICGDDTLILNLNENIRKGYIIWLCVIQITETH